VRRILSDPAKYLKTLAARTRHGWNGLFFTPADPTPLGVIRIVVGLLTFWSLFIFGLDLHDYFGSTGWADPDVVWQTQAQRQPFAWSFWFSIPDHLLRPVWLACLAIVGLYTAGLFSRVTAILTWIIIVSTVRRVPVALYGFDQIISTLALYLAATFASGQSVSLDRFLRRWRDARAAARSQRLTVPKGGRSVITLESGVPRPTIAANLALRLIQLHLAFIYAMAGLAKVQGPSWWNGLALWGTMAAGEFVTRDFTALAAWPLVLNAATHASLAFELLYAIFIWIPIFRPLMIAGAVVLHVGIAIVAPGLTEFGLAMIAGNLAFCSAAWLRSLVTGNEQPVLRILFDGACPRCRASMALVTAADPDRVLEPIDLNTTDVQALHPALTKQACLESMHAVLKDGRVTAGFDAVRSVGLCLPLFAPFSLSAWFPGVAWVGRRVYNHIAMNRPRDVPCTDDSCSLHRPTHFTGTREVDRSSGPSDSTRKLRAEELKQP
jgi:predicted DCC family thiol-disulfide oxidoreductase YuxK